MSRRGRSCPCCFVGGGVGRGDSPEFVSEECSPLRVTFGGVEQRAQAGSTSLPVAENRPSMNSPKIQRKAGQQGRWGRVWHPVPDPVGNVCQSHQTGGEREVATTAAAERALMQHPCARLLPPSTGSVLALPGDGLPRLRRSYVPSSRAGAEPPRAAGRTDGLRGRGSNCATPALSGQPRRHTAALMSLSTSSLVPACTDGLLGQLLLRLDRLAPAAELGRSPRIRSSLTCGPASLRLLRSTGRRCRLPYSPFLWPEAFFHSLSHRPATPEVLPLTGYLLGCFGAPTSLHLGRHCSTATILVAFWARTEERKTGSGKHWAGKATRCAP